MDRGIDEGDQNLEHQYGRAQDTELYEMMLAQFMADRAAARNAIAQPPHTESPSAVTDAAATAFPPDLAPMHMWLIIEGMSRGDPRLDWRAECALLAANRWLPILYDADEIPGRESRAMDAEYVRDRVEEDSPAGCRNGLIALLGVLDGPDVTATFDVDGLVADVRTATSGNDPLVLERDTLLSMAERRRFAGR